jgi:alpha-1,6-mannosyltransferase
VLALAPRLGARVVWGLIIAALVGFGAAPVLLSHDVYSYVDYARLGVVHGLDPYVYPPETVPSDPAYAQVTWTEATSVYGPLFTLLTYPLAWLGVGAAVAVLKAAAALAVGLLAMLVAKVAAWRGADPLRAAAFVALNPLVLVHVVGGAHNDGLMMALAMAAVAAALVGRWRGAGAALLAAIAVKSAAAVLAPFALLAACRPEPGSRNKRPATGRLRTSHGFLAGALGAAVAIAGAAWLGFGWDWLGALGLAGENQERTSHMSIPITLARLTGLDPDPVRAAAFGLYALALALLLLRTWRGHDWVAAAAWAALGLLLATAWLLPWYLVWVLPLAAVSRNRPLQLLTLALTAYQLGARIPL